MRRPFTPFLIATAAVWTAAGIGCTDSVTEPEVEPPPTFPDEPAPDPHPEVVAFIDVNVVPMNAPGVAMGQTVVVRGDRIETVGPVASTPVPDGAFVIQGQGRYLMPGLADMHVHVTQDTFAELRNDFWLFLANGVTTIRVMWGGTGSLAERDRIARGEVLGPTMLMASPGIDGPGGVWSGSTPPVTTASEATARVREHEEKGYDFIKVYNDLTLEMYDAILDEADALGIPVVGHVPSRVGLDHVLDRRQLTLEHFIGFKLLASTPFTGGALDLPRVRELAQRSAAAGVWHTPTVEVDALSSDRVAEIQASPEFDLVSPGMRDFFATGFFHGRPAPVASRERVNHLATLAEVHSAGGRLLVGTDAGFGWILPGYSIHDELAHFAAAGLAPFDVLAAATSRAAQSVAGDAEWGSIVPGRRADLILANANPLSSVEWVAHSSGVMVRGRWLSRGTFDRRLEEIRVGYGN